MGNRYLTAFKENYNLLGLASAVALAVACGHPAPLVIGLAAEAVYLLFVPRSSWYAARLHRQHEGLQRGRHEEVKAEVLPLLHPRLRERFARLENTRAEVDRHAGPDSLWIRQVVRQLDFLLDKFLEFARSDEQFRAYLKEARAGVREKGDDPAPPRLALDGAWIRDTVTLVEEDYQRQVRELETRLTDKADEEAQPILRKRIEVLQRRREFISKIGKIAENLNQQLALIEDAFGLIRDELLAQPPEQVLADVEDVVSQTRIMTELLEGIAPYERMLESVGKPLTSTHG